MAAIAAAPRATGSDAIDSARERCERELRALGFEVHQRPFEFSEFPGRFGTPLVGAAAALAVGFAGFDGISTGSARPFAILGATALTLVVAGLWLARRGVLDAPVLRRRGVNLEAVRGQSSPRIWLCAHLDSKSQPIPTLVRSAGIVLEAIGFLVMLSLATAAALGLRVAPLFWTFAAVVTLVGAIPVMLSMVGSRSPGALDNASGVTAAIAAAHDLGARPGVGVLITDAEELGLAGARAWSRSHTNKGTVLNCDGVDDMGHVAVMYSGRRPTALLQCVQRAAHKMGRAYSPTRMIPGVLIDSVAFTDAGIASVTFSKGDWRSLARIHSRRDTLSRLRGTGIAEVAVLMTLTAIELEGEG